MRCLKEEHFTVHTVSLLMQDKLVDAGKRGDGVEVTGICRAMSVRGQLRIVKSLFKIYIDCLHIKKSVESRMLIGDTMEVDNPQGKNAEVAFDEEKVAKLKMSKDPIYMKD